MESVLDSWVQGEGQGPLVLPPDVADVVRDVQLARRFGYVVPDASGAHLDWMLKVDEMLRGFQIE